MEDCRTPTFIPGEGNGLSRKIRLTEIVWRDDVHDRVILIDLNLVGLWFNPRQCYLAKPLDKALTYTLSNK